MQVFDESSLLPDRIVEPAIQDWRLLSTSDGNGLARRNLFLRCGCGDREDNRGQAAKDSHVGSDYGEFGFQRASPQLPRHSSHSASWWS